MRKYSTLLRSSILFTLGLSLIAGALRAQESPAQEKPNLIYIMTDDLGYGDLGCFGQQQIKTPYLDRLASEGMKLTSYYAGCTVCRPSRLSLWTGLHTGHTPIDSNAQYQFRPEDITVAELLKTAGYTTGGIGKWAMGGVGSTGHPNQNGFDFWMGYLDQSEAHNYYPTHLWRNETKMTLPGNVIGEYENGRGRVASRRETYSHDVMTDYLFDFIRSNQNQPFLMHVHWTIPHANNEGGRVLGDGMEVPDYGEYASRDWPNVEKGQAAMITRMDNDVGRLIGVLYELGIQQKTLVIFTSDNGPHSEGGHQHEYFDANGPLRGYKRDLYDGGIRAPTIAWWPGRIKPGTVSDEPLAAYDWLPTACELAGVTPPEKTDGISYVPTLLGQQQPSHEYLFWSYGDKKAIRKGDWKAVIPGKDKPLELYNLASDIGEQHNLAEQNRPIAQQLAAFISAAQQ